MRILHTSDWHLGHTLKEQVRGPEHDAFLAWLVAQIADESPDLLLIAGDVFDAPNPPASAVRAWYRFLLAAHKARPTLTVVVIGGNHDSGARLDAPSELLGHFRVHVVGATPQREDRSIDSAAMLLPIFDDDGRLLARVAAVPYLRPSDLPGGEDPDRWVDAIRTVYADVFALAPDDGVPLIAMGHSYMVGGKVSDLSERKVLGGNLHALPVDIFPERVAYAALGHLHLAQSVGSRASVRYCGSPIPLALDERDYEHQIGVVDLLPAQAASYRKVPVPRTVAFPRVPAKGSLPLSDLVAELLAFPADTRAWIEACVTIGPLDGTARAAVDAAMDHKQARVLAVTTEGGAPTASLADVADSTSLAELTPADVFEKRWAAVHRDTPMDPLLWSLFHQLVETASRSDA